VDEKRRERARQLQADLDRYGYVIIDSKTGNRIDPGSMRSDMDEESSFNPGDFFKAIRQSASVKAGAIMFGQAQIAYYDTLKESGMSEEDAFNLLAHTTEQVVKGVFSAVGPLADVLLRGVAMFEYFESIGLKTKPTDKEVPGE